MPAHALLPENYTPKFPALCIACGRNVPTESLEVYAGTRSQRPNLRGKGKPHLIPICADCRPAALLALTHERKQDFAQNIGEGVIILAILAVIYIYDVSAQYLWAWAILLLLSYVVGQVARRLIPTPEWLPFKLFNLAPEREPTLTWVFYLEEFGRQFLDLNRAEIEALSAGSATVQVLLNPQYTPVFPEMCVACGQPGALGMLDVYSDSQGLCSKPNSKCMHCRMPVCAACRKAVEHSLHFDRKARRWAFWGGVLGACINLGLIAATELPSMVLLIGFLPAFFAFLGVWCMIIALLPAPERLPFAVYQVLHEKVELKCWIFMSGNFGRNFQALNRHQEVVTKDRLNYFDGALNVSRRFKLSTLIIVSLAVAGCLGLDVSALKYAGFDNLSKFSIGFGFFLMFIGIEVVFIVRLLNYLETGSALVRRR